MNNTTDYQKRYREKYKSENKIVTFPLSNIFYEELRKRGVYYDLTTNSYAKHIITNFLNNDTSSLLSTDRAEYIAEYIRISRGIANNINQLAYRSNIGEQIDQSILINALKHFEQEFKNFISKA